MIIPTLNAQKDLPATFASLMSALIDDMISEVIVVDGGSDDDTCPIANAAGASFIRSDQTGRGAQLAEGAKQAKSQWLLFLHADTELEADWHKEARDFILAAKDQPKAAAFSFALKDKGLMPFLLTKAVAFRCKLFSLPYGDQGLLISKKTYDHTGGYKALPLMEDIDLVRRLNFAPKILKSRGFTSAVRYQQDGYIKRITRNLFCLLAFYRGTPTDKIKVWYDAKK